ncbi:ParA family protein [Ruminococcus albus]|uniref:Chromosome partitioning protein n=1 Tax=Ruminococcus albus TaxID=1264 RepID=A0A1H7GGZ9_RUMAL|nr:hypothetical protein [Ruminococcus albus]SEK35075.1 chromosome partitioning protein [Ruminococcus albus]
MAREIGGEVWTSLLRNVVLFVTSGFGQPAIYYDKKAKGSKAYEELAKEILKREKKRRDK